MEVTKTDEHATAAARDYIVDSIAAGISTANGGWSEIDNRLADTLRRRLHGGDSYLVSTHEQVDVRVTVPVWRATFPYIHRNTFCALLNSGLVTLPTRAKITPESLKNPRCISAIDVQLQKLGYEPGLSRACKDAGSSLHEVPMSIATAKRIVESLTDPNGSGFYHCDYTIAVAVNVLRALNMPKALRGVLKRENFAHKTTAKKEVGAVTLTTTERKALKRKVLYDVDDDGLDIAAEAASGSSEGSRHAYDIADVDVETA